MVSMFIATVVVAVLLATVLLISAYGKLVRDPAQMATLRKVAFPENLAPLLALAEISGATGLLVGLLWRPVGEAAALGVMAYFIGATGSHLRVRDGRVVAPLALLCTGAVALGLRHVSG